MKAQHCFNCRILLAVKLENSTLHFGSGLTTVECKFDRLENFRTDLYCVHQQCKHLRYNMRS